MYVCTCEHVHVVYEDGMDVNVGVFFLTNCSQLARVYLTLRLVCRQGRPQWRAFSSSSPPSSPE